MLFVIFELVYNHISLLINILLFQSYNVLLLYMYMYNFIYAIPILEWVLYIYLTQTNTTMIIININLISRSFITMTFYLINRSIIFKFYKFEISIIVKAIYLNLEFHRVFRVMSMIALYIVHVTLRYVKTKCWWPLTILSSYKNMSRLLDSINNVPTMKKNTNVILYTISNNTFLKSVYTLITVYLIICDVASSLTRPYCNQVVYLVTGFLYTIQFAHVQVVTVLKIRTHCLVVFIIIDLYCLITIVKYNHRFMAYDINVSSRSTCSTYVSNIITVLKGSFCTDLHNYHLAQFIKMLINTSYYISLILLGQKCLYMIIILYQTIVILNTYILKYIYSIVSFNEPILVYMYTYFVILFKINSYHEVIYLNKMITIIQVKAHFMKFNCFSLHSLTSVIFLHTILQSLRFTVLLCMFIDINILHDHDVVPVQRIFKCVIMYKCDRQLHYQDNSNLLPTKGWMNFIYKNIYIVSLLLMLYIIYIFLLLRLICDVSDFKFHALWKQLNIHNTWNMSIMMCIENVTTVMYYVLKGYRGAENYIISHLTYELG